MEELAAIESDLDLKLKELDRKFSGAIDQLVLSYDEHMKMILPKPKLLPIRINVAIPCKGGLRIENVHVKAYDNVEDVFKVVEEYQLQRGDPVLSWQKETIKVRVTGPLYEDGLEEAKNED